FRRVFPSLRTEHLLVCSVAKREVDRPTAVHQSTKSLGVKRGSDVGRRAALAAVAWDEQRRVRHGGSQRPEFVWIGRSDDRTDATVGITACGARGEFLDSRRNGLIDGSACLRDVLKRSCT